MSLRVLDLALVVTHALLLIPLPHNKFEINQFEQLEQYITLIYGTGTF
jgi:hypothetical protein